MAAVFSFFFFSFAFTTGQDRYVGRLLYDWTSLAGGRLTMDFTGSKRENFFALLGTRVGVNLHANRHVFLFLSLGQAGDIEGMTGFQRTIHLCG